MIAREVLGLKTFFFSAKTYLSSKLRNCKCKNGVTGSIYSSWGARKKLPHQWHFIASFYVSRLFVAQLPSTHRHSLLGRSKAGKFFLSPRKYFTIFVMYVFLYLWQVCYPLIQYITIQPLSFPCISVLLKLIFFTELFYAETMDFSLIQKHSSCAPSRIRVTERPVNLHSYSYSCFYFWICI